MRTLIALLLLTIPAVASDRTALIEGNNAFALEVYRREATPGRGNLFFSPFSISSAMAMVDVGARSETATEIEKTMHWGVSGERLSNAWSTVQKEVRGSRGAELSSANALWVARGVRH